MSAHAPNSDAHDHPAHGEPHVEPVKTYLLVFAALMVLLVLTSVAAAFDLGHLNIAIALIIAVTKAMLVALFFMHLRHSTRLTWLFASAALLWLVILLALTLNDYLTRDKVPERRFVPPTKIQPHMPEH